MEAGFDDLLIKAINLKGGRATAGLEDRPQVLSQSHRVCGFGLCRRNLIS